MTMFIAQCQAELRRLFRNKFYVIWSLCVPIFFYFLYTKIISIPMKNEEAWHIHYLMSMTVFSVMGSSIMSIGMRLVQERAFGWTHYLRVTPLPSSLYFLAKMVSQTLIHVVSIIIIFLVGYVMNDIQLTWSSWIGAACWILVMSLPFLALGLMIGTMKSVDTAAGIANVLYLGLAITGGLWMPVDVFPSLVQKMVHYLPSYQYGSGAWAITTGHYPSLSMMASLIGYFLLFMVVSLYIHKKQEGVA
ncbi:ABC transporter permease [Fictibacillus macauensis]|nr:ABC transporter permease [Fictibacillus macauensis]